MVHAAHPRLTCVINVRNGERFIRETLVSAFAQTIPVQVLVVDNHSTDGTRGIVDSFPEAVYVKTPEPMELGPARSYSLNFVETEFVAWLDADDLWEKDFGAVNLEAFARDPANVLSGCGCILIDQVGQILPRWRQIKSVRGRERSLFAKGDSVRSLARSMQARSCWSGYVFKTAVVKAVGGFNPKYRHAVDFDLIIRALTRGKSVYINRNLLKLRIHPQQATRTFKPEELYSESYNILRDNNVTYHLFGADTLHNIEMISNFRIAAGCFFARHSLRDAWQAFKYACRPAVAGWLVRYLWARRPV